MSSHHIIREKQEPALLVLGLDQFTEELLGQLLEWSPTLIVTTHAAETINSLGIKYDILIDDTDNLIDVQSDIKHIVLKGDTPTVAAFKYLTANGYPAVNIVTDEFDLNEYLPYAAQINIVIFHDHQKIYPITSGFSKWKPAGETIRVLSPVNHLVFSGLIQTGNQLYQTIADGMVSLHFSISTIFIAESIV